MTDAPVAVETLMTEPAAPDRDDLFAEASGWYFRLQAEDATTAERERFACWLARGAAQYEAWQEVQLLLGSLREPARRMREAEQARWNKPAGQRWLPRACAAAVVLMTIGLLAAQTPGWIAGARTTPPAPGKPGGSNWPMARGCNSIPTVPCRST